MSDNGISEQTANMETPQPEQADNQENTKTGAVDTVEEKTTDEEMQEQTQDSTETASEKAKLTLTPPRPAEEEDSLSMVDVLQEEVQLEADAHAVLGGSDAAVCTYEQDSVPRQALYSCSTCKTVDDSPAGVCLACSLECHDGHELYELYTKRNFRCDCGNKKYVDSKCKLTAAKSATINGDNVYSQNFRGMYCTCHRPYPDPEDEVEDDMIQCSVCEDWYHGRHVGLESPEFDHDELICTECMKKLDFLYKYSTLFPLMHPKSAEKIQKVDLHITEDIDITTVTGGNDVQEKKEDKKEEKKEAQPSEEEKPAVNETKESESDTADKPTVENGETEEKKTDDSTQTDDKKENTDESSKTATTPDSIEKTDKNSTVSKDSSEAAAESTSEVEECTFRVLKAFNIISIRHEGATFWPENWREKLCTCTQCKNMYERLGVSFLTNTEDTITAYEDRGAKQTQPDTQYETGMKALQNMGRIQQVEVLSEYNTMKDALTDYLKKFADNKKMVREEDIREFFQDLSSRKRQRLDMSHFCK